MKNPVDAVILWVDGNDPNWIKKRDQYWPDFATKYKIKCHRTNTKSRYVACNELRYCLRGLNNYVPWLRHIFLVTNGQVPNWLKDHPKIKLIKHQQIMEKKNLPTFNSSAIEMNLHKIPNLSPVFLYLNDDFFITRSVDRNRFFGKNNKGYYYSYTKLTVPTSDYYNSFSWIIHSDEQCLNQLFKPKIRPRPFHQAFIVYRSAYEYLAQHQPNLMKQTSGHRFRVDSLSGEYSLNIYAIEAIGLELGLYQLLNVNKCDHQLQQYFNSDNIRSNSDKILRSPPIFLCLNDLASDQDRELVDQLMNKLIRKPADWENI